MAGVLVQSIVMITDSAFLSRLSDADGIPFVASGNSGMIYVSSTMFLTGLMEGAQIIMSRRIGEHKYLDVGRVFRHIILIALLVGLGILLIHQFVAPAAFESIVQNKSIGSAMTEFLSIRSWGIIPMALQIAFSAFYLGTGRSAIFMFASILFAASNIFLDYGMIFGNFGFPELGLKGAAYATVVAEWSGAIFLITYGLLDKKRGKFELFKSIKVEFSIIKRILKISIPLMLQGMLAMGTWTVFFTMIEHMGKNELEISHTLRNIYFIAFVPFFGFGATTKTMISTLMGEGRLSELGVVIKRIIILNVSFLILTMHGTFLYPEFIINLINPNQTLMQETIPLLKLIAGSMLLFAVATILFNTVSGSGNTTISMTIEFTAICIYLTISAIMIYIIQADIFNVWLMEYIYFAAIGTFSYIYLKRSNWKLKSL